MFIYNLQSIAKKMELEFNGVTTHINHPGVKGTTREDMLKKYLKELFPKRYSITSGIIIDSEQNNSNQQDLIIYDSFNSPNFFETETNKILPIESIYATIEIKSSLSKETLKQCVDNIKSVRSLKKQVIPYMDMYKYPVGFVFAYTSDTSLETLQKNLYEFNKEIKPEYQISIICVLDKGLIFNVKGSNITEYTIYLDSETTIGRSESNLENNLYSFYLLVMQYLNSIRINTPNLIEYAKEMNAFNISVEIPSELLKRDNIYNQNGIIVKYGEIQDLLNINKKYPNLFSNNLTYDEFYNYMKNDFVFVMKKLAEINNIKLNSINMYGYIFKQNEFLEIENLIKDINVDDNKNKFEQKVKNIYNFYLNSIKKD